MKLESHQIAALALLAGVEVVKAFDSAGVEANVDFPFWYVVHNPMTVDKFDFVCLEADSNCELAFSPPECTGEQVCSSTCPDLQLLSTLTPSNPAGSLIINEENYQGAVMCSTGQIFAQEGLTNVARRGRKMFYELVPTSKAGTKFAVIGSKTEDTICSMHSISSSASVTVQEQTYSSDTSQSFLLDTISIPKGKISTIELGSIENRVVTFKGTGLFTVACYGSNTENYRILDPLSHSTSKDLYGFVSTDVRFARLDCDTLELLSLTDSLPTFMDREMNYQDLMRVGTTGYLYLDSVRKIMGSRYGGYGNRVSLVENDVNACLVGYIMGQDTTTYQQELNLAKNFITAVDSIRFGIASVNESTCLFSDLSGRKVATEVTEGTDGVVMSANRGNRVSKHTKISCTEPVAIFAQILGANQQYPMIGLQDLSHWYSFHLEIGLIEPPTTSPSTSPTTAPTSNPTSTPSASPSTSSSTAPTKSPTSTPSTSPSTSPSTAPTKSPTSTPSTSPSTSPSTAPTNNPTSTPSASPSTSPSSEPTRDLTVTPTTSPSASPSTAATRNPTFSPTDYPSIVSTGAPIGSPTIAPSVRPADEEGRSTTGVSWESAIGSMDVLALVAGLSLCCLVAVLGVFMGRQYKNGDDESEGPLEAKPLPMSSRVLGATLHRRQARTILRFDTLTESDIDGRMKEKDIPKFMTNCPIDL